MKEVRERKRWSQQDLANRLAEMGDPTDRATIARTETRARGLSLDDAVAYAAALGASFVHMVCPLDRTELVALGSKMAVPSVEVRDWIRGQRSLRPEDERTLVMESPDEEWMARQHVYLDVAINRMQAVLDALALGDQEGVKELTPSANEALVRLRRESADRPGKAG
jgi:transcriptional regulator with XRE-family HTH domain